MDFEVPKPYQVPDLLAYHVMDNFQQYVLFDNNNNIFCQNNDKIEPDVQTFHKSNRIDNVCKSNKILKILQTKTKLLPNQLWHTFSMFLDIL